MDYKLKTESRSPDLADDVEPREPSSYRISAQPVIDRTSSGEEASADDLPRSYGTETLTLMARDPHTLFAYWDIDWSAAFREEPAKLRNVLLRLLDAHGKELTSVEIEPMAGNSYVSVPSAGATYRGELGYFDPPETWNKLATSEIVTTPADVIETADEADFATVPFHLSFQHMLDRLSISKQENESLTAMLADLRARAADDEKQAKLNQEERDLAQAMDAAATQSSTQTRLPSRSDFWTQQRIKRILGIGSSSSPAGGFGGNSSNTR